MHLFKAKFTFPHIPAAWRKLPGALLQHIQGVLTKQSQMNLTVTVVRSRSYTVYAGFMICGGEIHYNLRNILNCS